MAGVAPCHAMLSQAFPHSSETYGQHLHNELKKLRKNKKDKEAEVSESSKYASHLFGTGKVGATTKRHTRTRAREQKYRLNDNRDTSSPDEIHPLSQLVNTNAFLHNTPDTMTNVKIEQRGPMSSFLGPTQPLDDLFIYGGNATRKSKRKKASTQRTENAQTTPTEKTPSAETQRSDLKPPNVEDNVPQQHTNTFHATERSKIFCEKRPRAEIEQSGDEPDLEQRLKFSLYSNFQPDPLKRKLWDIVGPDQLEGGEQQENDAPSAAVFNPFREVFKDESCEQTLGDIENMTRNICTDDEIFPDEKVNLGAFALCMKV